jgi:hypothetical protein
MILKKGSKGTDVKELQRALKELGYNVGVSDGHFGAATQRQVELFQEANDLYGDGIVGKGTLSILNELLPEDLQFQIDGEPDPEETFNKMPWTKVETDQVEGSEGYPYFRLRKDAAEAYNSLREDVLALGGVITSAGAKRSLTDAKPSSTRSIKSMHYTGLAFDLALDTMGNNPKKDTYVFVEAGDRKWDLWCRTENEEVPVVELEATTYRNTKMIVKDRFFCFTDIAEKHGWKGIRARRTFFRGGTWLGCEAWHWQWEAGLVPGASTFGGELLKLYSKPECKTFVHWDITKNCVWQESWF